MSQSRLTARFVPKSKLLWRNNFIDHAVKIQLFSYYPLEYSGYNRENRDGSVVGRIGFLPLDYCPCLSTHQSRSPSSSKKGKSLVPMLALNIVVIFGVMAAATFLRKKAGSPSCPAAVVVFINDSLRRTIPSVTGVISKAVSLSQLDTSLMECFPL